VVGCTTGADFTLQPCIAVAVQQTPAGAALALTQKVLHAQSFGTLLATGSALCEPIACAIILRGSCGGGRLLPWLASGVEDPL